MTRIVAALLVRNEAGPDRYLERVMQSAGAWADTIVVLDDNSTDATAEIARDIGGTVYKRNNAQPMWGNEAPARAELWECAAHLAGDGWILVLDADMILVGDPRPLTESWDCAAWAWPLVDLWDSEDTFRIDGAWQFGPKTPRPWMFRPQMLREPAIWRDSRLHTGHAPLNFANAGPTAITPDLYWLHYSYLQPEHRKAKSTQYLAHADALSPFELQHARSIND